MDTVTEVEQDARRFGRSLHSRARELKLPLIVWLVYGILATCAGFVVLNSNENAELENWVSLAIMIMLPLVYCLAGIVGIRLRTNESSVYSDQVRRHWRTITPSVVRTVSVDSKVFSILMGSRGVSSVSGVDQSMIEIDPMRAGVIAYLDLKLLAMDTTKPLVHVNNSEHVKTGTSNTTLMLQ